MVADVVLQRGDVWWAESPLWNRRPVVLLTRDSVVNRLTSITLVLVTTTIRDLPSEVLLDETDGMPRSCVVNLDNIATQHRSVLLERITQLTAVKIHQICNALATAQDC